MKRIVLLLLIPFQILAVGSAQNINENEKNVRLEHRYGVSTKFGGAYDILGGIALDAFMIDKEARGDAPKKRSPLLRVSWMMAAIYCKSSSLICTCSMRSLHS